MAEVMKMIDGMVETVFSGNDFVYLVDKYMGYDAKNYAQELIDELRDFYDREEEFEKSEERIEELENKLKDLERNYDRLEKEYEHYKQEHGEQF